MVRAAVSDVALPMNMDIDSFSLAIEELGLSERDWFILESRFGFCGSSTLEEVAYVLEVTRERVRQLQTKAITKGAIVYRNQAVRSFCAYLESHLRDEDMELAVLDINEAKQVLASTLRQGSPSSIGESIIKFMTLIRALIKTSAPSDGDRHWPKMTQFVCAVTPAIEEHAAVKHAVQKRRNAARRWTYEELAEHVLRESGRPLHWRTIVERSEALNRRRAFNSAGLYNVLQAKHDKFVRVGQGTYGLKSWGLQAAEYYTDIIAEVLELNGEPMTLNEVFARVHSIRSAKRSSISAFLETHPRFYRSKERTYGLRRWLKPRAEQTLLTPDAFVEDLSSYARLKRAAERGYAVCS